MFRIQQTITSDLPPDEILLLFEKHMTGPMNYSFMVISTEQNSASYARLCLQVYPLQFNVLMPVFSCNILATGNTTTIQVQPSHFRKVFTLLTTGAVLFLYLLFSTETDSSRSLLASILLTLTGFGSASIIALLSYRYCTGKIASTLRQLLHTEARNQVE